MEVFSFITPVDPRHNTTNEAIIENQAVITNAEAIVSNLLLPYLLIALSDVGAGCFGATFEM